MPEKPCKEKLLQITPEDVLAAALTADSIFPPNFLTQRELAKTIIQEVIDIMSGKASESEADFLRRRPTYSEKLANESYLARIKRYIETACSSLKVQRSPF